VTENKAVNIAMSTEAVFSWPGGHHHCQTAVEQVVDVLTLAQIQTCQWW